jgi:hypothetical protein
MAILSGPKRGISGRSLGVKLKLSFLSLFEEIFSIKFKNSFFRILRKFSALRDKRFSSYGVLSVPKRGIFGSFFGCKIENHLSGHF